MIRLVSRARGVASGPWRYGLANLRRRTWGSLVQIMALGLGIMAMLMLTLVRTELITKWQQSMPPDMPNRFAVNIQGDQLAGVALFRGAQARHPRPLPDGARPMVAIGDKAIGPADYTDQRAAPVEREFNLSWASDPAPTIASCAGTFWTPESTDPQFSVEEGLAKTLGIKVGDLLTFDVAGSRFTAKATNLRKVDWDSFKPNFFVISSPALLRGYPASWITSFHLPQGREEVVSELVRRFPNVSVIDLSALMAQFQRITDQVSRAVEFVFLFAIAAGRWCLRRDHSTQTSASTKAPS